MKDLLPLIPVFLFVGVVCLVALVIYAGYAAEKKRREELASTAETLGLTFSAAGDPALLSQLGSFQLLSQGHGKKLYNLLSGQVGGAEVAVFDYQYTTGGGKSSHTHQQTAVSLALGISLPAFTLRPEGFWDKVGAALFGLQDINFESHPTFSKQYLLRGLDEAGLRRLFSADVLEFFEQSPGLSVQSAGGTLLYYRTGKRVDPGNVKALLDETLELAARLLASAASGGTGT